MSTRTILTALFATTLTMSALAQPATPPAEQPAVAPASAPAAAAPATAAPAAAAAVAPAVSRDKDTLSVDFPDEDIKTILRNVADLFELNLVVPDTLTGKTSIKLREVTWHQIFHVVLTPVGYTYVEEGNIIKIVSNELLQQEPVATEVFILNNAKAADIKPTIDGLIEAATGGKIVVDGRSNSLVITERPSRMGRIRSIIDQLDKATDQVMIESKFVEVTDNDIRNIGANWAGLKALSLGATNITQTFTKNSGQDSSNFGSNSSGNQNNGQNNTATNVSGGNTVTYVTVPNAGVTGIPSTTSFPTGSVSGLPSSVPSTTTLANITPTSATALTTYNGTNTTSSNGTTSDSVNSAFNSLASLTNTGSTSRLASAVFSASNFNVVISALKEQGNTKIVSNPTVVTLNNSEATLNLAEEFPLPNYTYNEQTGRYAVSGFNYKSIGVILKVTPQVNGRGIIKLNVEPEVSTRTGTSSFGDAVIPIIGTRKVKTQVSLKDGYTMGLGGLITSNSQHGGTKVPVLGSIPVLGRLFSSKSVNDTSTNLLIFITAKTVAADGASPEQVFDPRSIQATGMTREDLPGNRAAKGTDVFAPAPVAPADGK